MQKYSKNLVDLFYNAKFSGAISGADVIVKNQDEESGEIVKVYLVVRNDILYDCSFQAKGSIVLYASLTTICSLSKEKTLSEILSINERDVINELKQLNKQEYKEVVFALESFKKAVVTYSKRKQQGTIVEKNNLKAKNLHPAKNITRYQESSRPCNIEMALSNKDNDSKGADSDFMQSEKIEDKKVVKTQKIVQIENQEKPLDKPSAIDRNMQKLEALINEVKLEQPVKVNKELEEESSEMMIIPVGGKKKNKKSNKSNVVIPTKIEVRVFDEDKEEVASKRVTKTTKITTTKTIKTEEKKENPYLIQAEPEKSASDEEVIDEIDSITEQLTNAISQLNFKFDDEDK